MKDFGRRWSRPIGPGANRVATLAARSAREACDLCVQECNAAGYHAIEYTKVGTEVDDDGFPIEDSGYLAPVVLEEQCVGCGLCQTRCYAINVKEKGLLAESAIIIEAGEGKEDRMMSGSYLEKRRQEKQQRQSEATQDTPEFFLPDESEPSSSEAEPAGDDDNPFGI